MSRISRRILLGAGLAAPFIAREGFAQGDWPKGPVRWVVAFAAGGAADTVARNIGVRVSEIIGQQVIIDNRTGGNAVVAANAVLQAPRDGQTFLIDAANVKQDFPSKTIQEYIAAAKAKPGTISYGTPPAAGMAHMAGEELQRRAGIKLIHVPYRGGADAARDIGAGAVDSVIITTNSIRPPVATGRARVLAVTSLKRSVAFPDVPTLAESGYPGFDLSDWNGLFAATGTPPAVVAEAVKDPKVKERLDPTGADLVANTPAQFKTWINGQRELLGKLIVEAGIKLQ